MLFHVFWIQVEYKIVCFISDKLVEGFFGVMTSRNQGNNLGIGDMARRLSNCAFKFLRCYVSTQGNCGVSLSNPRPAPEETYMYSFTGFMG